MALRIYVWGFRVFAPSRGRGLCGTPFVQLPQEECEGAEHPNVLAARDQDPASRGAYPPGPEHSLASGGPLVQTCALGVAPAQCASLEALSALRWGRPDHAPEILGRALHRID